MKSQVKLLTLIIRQAGSELGIKVDKDIETLQRRSEENGMFFLDTSLPTLDDALLQGLSRGRLDPIPGYSLQSKTALPRFLNGFWKSVFDEDGLLRPNPSVPAIRLIRQVARTYKKVFEVCSEDKVDAAVRQFVQTDQELALVSDRTAGVLREIAHIAWGRHIGKVVENLHQLPFRHGPGAVAEKLDSVARWEFNIISPSAYNYFGIDPFRLVWSASLEAPPTIQEVRSRLIAVPKTASKPRLISIEPSCHQYLQQGVMSILGDEMSHIRMVSYRYQELNQELARRGSLDGSYATIDLSEASDRVSLSLLTEMFGFNPTFVEIIRAMRTGKVVLPDGEELILNKFSSMGSALTFPLEGLYFATLIIYSECKRLGDFSPRHIRRILRSGDYRVYGDDMIVPVDAAPALYRVLEEHGLVVNQAKSFCTGLFRESCGGDYWAGYNVTPTYARRRLPDSKRDVTEILSWVATANQLHQSGYTHSALWLRDYIEDITGPLGVSSGGESSDIAFVFGSSKVRERYNPSLQSFERLGVTVRSTYRKARAKEYAVLAKAIASAGKAYSGGFVVSEIDSRNLTHHGSPTSSQLKRRWVPAV